MCSTLRSELFPLCADDDVLAPHIFMIFSLFVLCSDDGAWKTMEGYERWLRSYAAPCIIFNSVYVYLCALHGSFIVRDQILLAKPRVVFNIRWTHVRRMFC